MKRFLAIASKDLIGKRMAILCLHRSCEHPEECRRRCDEQLAVRGTQRIINPLIIDDSYSRQPALRHWGKKLLQSLAHSTRHDHRIPLTRATTAV